MLTDVSLDLSVGVTALVGVNGAGKTTLLRAISTGMPVDSGDIEFDGRSIATAGGLQTARRRLGFMPQQLEPMRGTSLIDFLRYVAWHRGMPAREAEPRCRAALERVNLATRSRAQLATLSGGERRRALFAQALLSDPDFLLLDEPTTGVDPQQRAVMRDLITQHADGRVVLVSSHLVEDVAATASRVLMLARGRLIFDGTVDAMAGLAGPPESLPSSVSPLEAAFLALQRCEA